MEEGSHNIDRYYQWNSDTQTRGLIILTRKHYFYSEEWDRTLGYIVEAEFVS